MVRSLVQLGKRGRGRHRRARLGQDLRPRCGPTGVAVVRHTASTAPARGGGRRPARSRIGDFLGDPRPPSLRARPRRRTCRITVSIPAASWSSTRPAWSTPAASCGCWRSRGAPERKSCSQVMTGNSPRSRRAAALARSAASSERPGSDQMRARWPSGNAQRSRRFARAVPGKRPRPTPITDGSVARPTRPS